MRRIRSPVLAAVLAHSAIGGAAEQPLDKGIHEQVEVNLAIVDVQVLDKKGAAVRGLVASDFELGVDRRNRPIVSFDSSCEGSSEKPALVLVFDYQHLYGIQRGMALEAARQAIEEGRARGAEVMVAALTGGLRVEQPFTSEGDRAPASLRRMQFDVSLFAGDFSHITEDGFVRGMTALFDVAATLPQPKAVLFYSAMQDVPLDSQFRQLAAMASASRSVLYPIDVRGLDSGSAPARVSGLPPTANTMVATSTGVKMVQVPVVEPLQAYSAGAEPG